MANSLLTSWNRCIILSKFARKNVLQSLSVVQPCAPRFGIAQPSLSTFSESNSVHTALSNSKNTLLDVGLQNPTSIASNINQQLFSGNAGRLFAVVHVAGKQRKITTDDIIVLDKHIDADTGERIRLNKVLMVGSRDFSVVGQPVLSESVARVEATVIEKTLSHTKIMFWYHRRVNYKFFKLRKERLTYLRINSIELTPTLNQ